jgi:hypothetical protein
MVKELEVCNATMGKVNNKLPSQLLINVILNEKK